MLNRKKLVSWLLVLCLLFSVGGTVSADNDAAPGNDTPVSALTVTVESDREGQQVKAGQTITYTVTVENTGNMTIKDIKVEDELEGAKLVSGDSESIASLEPGGRATVHYIYVVTNEDVYREEAIRNIVSATGRDTTGTEVSASDFCEAPTAPVSAALTVTKESDCGDKWLRTGDTVTYTVTVENTGSLIITDIKIEDELEGAKLVPGDSETVASLAPGGSATVHYTYVVTDEDVLKEEAIRNIATATGKDPKSNTVTDSDFCEDPTEPINAELTVTKESDRKGQPVKAGDTVTYTVTVENTGNLTIKDIKIEDELEGAKLVSGDSETVASLAPGGSATVHYTYVVTDEDVLKEEAIRNIATATGKDPKSNTVTDSDFCEDPTEPINAELTVTKESDRKGQPVKAGDTVTYTVTVENTGNLTIKDITVEDTLEGAKLVSGDSETIASLAPGGSAAVHYTYVVTDEDVLKGTVIRNTATADGTDPLGNFVDAVDSCEDPTAPANAALTVTKDSDREGQQVKAGETITYTVTVENTGNLTVKDITVEDTLEGAKLVPGDSETITLLAPGGSAAVHYTYVVTDADVYRGTAIHNTATADGTDPLGNFIDAVGFCDNYVAPINAALSVAVKSDREGQQVKAGQTITYTVTVENAGSVTVKDIKVEDDLEGARLVPGDSETITLLAPSDSAAVHYTYVVTDDDVYKEDTVCNLATATGKDPKGGTVTFCDFCEDPTAPVSAELTVTKGSDREGEMLKAGDTVTYTVTVENTGSVTIKDIKVEDELEGARLVPGDSETFALLMPGNSVTVHYTYVVTDDDVYKEETVRNIATATGKDPKGGTVTDSDFCEDVTEPVNAELTVNKKSSLNGAQAKFGETITYTVTVTNTGNLTIKDITVDDELKDAHLLPGESNTIASLLPGASATVHFTYTVTYDDFLEGAISNIATATGKDPKGSTVTADDNCEDAVDPAAGDLTISKTVTGDRGDKTKYFTFTVTFSADGTFSYTGSKSGTISNGGTVQLKHGESITIVNIPAGVNYTVTESDNTGYRVYKSGNTGTIADGKTATAKFTNTKSSVPITGENSAMEQGIGLMGAAVLGIAVILFLAVRKRRGAAHSKNK